MNCGINMENKELTDWGTYYITKPYGNFELIIEYLPIHNNIKKWFNDEEDKIKQKDYTDDKIAYHILKHAVESGAFGEDGKHMMTEVLGVQVCESGQFCYEAHDMDEAIDWIEENKYLYEIN